ncbi:hypothetical protein [Amycolatopsis sp. NPDC049159]|uniref:hypothetical protein n=1 Tax=Amycolatopsis sp. NPDC049159 TaxID=3157210 RepID=UPI0033DDDC8E
MSLEHLEHLGLDPEQVRRTAQFHEAYARTAEFELESAYPANSSKDRSREDDLTFILIADAASAWREAGQWALLLDPAKARQLLQRSGNLFRRLGQAFGMYLGLVATGQGQDADRGVLAQAVIQASGLRTKRTETRGVPGPLPGIHLQQQQQAYLVLTAGAVASRAETLQARVEDDPLTEPLIGMLTSSPHRSGVLPVGSLGTPIHRFWSVAGRLLRGGPEDVYEIARHVVAMCRAYEETISLARTNTYLWGHGAAPVDIADLDIGGIAALTSRTFGRDTLLSALADVPDGRGLSPIGRVPIELGAALAGGSDDSFGRQ